MPRKLKKKDLYKKALHATTTQQPLNVESSYLQFTLRLKQVLRTTNLY